MFKIIHFPQILNQKNLKVFQFLLIVLFAYMMKLLKILNHNRIRINNYLKLIINKDKNKKKIKEMNNIFNNKRNRKKYNIVINYQKIEIKQFTN